jgi:hypothetical protein
MPTSGERAFKFQEKQRKLYAEIMSKIEEINNVTTEIENLMLVATNASGISEIAVSDVSIVEKIYNHINNHHQRLVTMKREITMSRMSSSNTHLNEDSYIAWPTVGQNDVREVGLSVGLAEGIREEQEEGLVEGCLEGRAVGNFDGLAEGHREIDLSVGLAEGIPKTVLRRSKRKKIEK